MRSGLERRQIHEALFRPVLFAGLPQALLWAEIVVVVCAAISLGPQLLTAVCIGVVVLVMHPFLVWAVAKDPDMVDAFLRLKLEFSDFYSAQPGLRARRVSVKPSIPSPR